jgi:hypothetical protein
MAQVQKDVMQLRKAFAALVEAHNGQIHVVNQKGGTRCNYQIGERKAYLKWHSSLSDQRAILLLKKDLYKVADQLEISRDLSSDYIKLIVRVDHEIAWSTWVETSDKIFQQLESAIKD